MTIPMPVLFRACLAVLMEEMCPLHYVELTKRALARMGFDPDPNGVVLRKAMEDVREKLLCRQRHGTGYVGSPDCLAAMRDWFQVRDLLLNPDAYTVYVPGNATHAQRAAEELALRSPHMIAKKAGVPNEIRWKARARGLTIEHHVSPWFRERWPTLYLPPLNEGRYDVPCDHDFRLHVGAHRMRVDVMGPLADGTFGLPPQKRPADIHVLASIQGADVVIHGHVGGSFLAGGVRTSPEQAEPISRLLVWLNCNARGLDYGRIRRALAA